MRPVVQAECTLKESAAINQILGRRVSWKYPTSLLSLPLSLFLWDVSDVPMVYDILIFQTIQWHSLSREEQAKYYEKARIERQRHMQLYPHWNARDNYRYGAKKKKRKRDKSDDPGARSSGGSPASQGGRGSFTAIFLFINFQFCFSGTN